jgi:hypothetical protein
MHLQRQEKISLQQCIFVKLRLFGPGFMYIRAGYGSGSFSFFEIFFILLFIF